MLEQHSLEPTSHYYISQRLKLHFVDWGNSNKPLLALIHGGSDHARTWDWVARALRHDYHIIAPTCADMAILSGPVAADIP